MAQLIRGDYYRGWKTAGGRPVTLIGQDANASTPVVPVNGYIVYKPVVSSPAAIEAVVNGAISQGKVNSLLTKSGLASTLASLE